MSIRQAKDLAVKAVATMDRVSAKTGIDVSQIEVTDLIGEYSDILFTEITTLFNWVFVYRNPEYKKVTKTWIGDNISIRILTEIVKEIAVQNKLDWLGPFIKGKITSAVEIALRS